MQNKKYGDLTRFKISKKIFYYYIFYNLFTYNFASGLNSLNADWSYDGATVTLAKLNLTYQNPNVTHKIQVVSKGELGRFGIGAVGGPITGLLVLGQSFSNLNKTENSGLDRYGCSKSWLPSPPEEPWVALIAKGGGCTDVEKVQIATSMNASAVIVFAADQHAHLQQMPMGLYAGEFILLFA